MESPVSGSQMRLIITVLCFCSIDSFKFTFNRESMVTTILYDQSKVRQSLENELKARKISESLYFDSKSTLKKKDIKSLSCDMKIKPTTKAVESSFSCYFEKNTPCSSCRSGICPVDNRPCESNREYMDHIYGARYMPKPKPVFQSFKYSQQSQMQMYAAKPSPPPPEIKLTVAEERTRYIYVCIYIWIAYI
jgi:hypothetical protein